MSDDKFLHVDARAVDGGEIKLMWNYKTKNKTKKNNIMVYLK